MYYSDQFPTPVMEEVSYFYSLWISDHGYYYLVINKQHNKKGFSKGRITHIKKLKELFFYLYDVESFKIQFNIDISEDTPSLYFLLFYPS